MEENEIYVSLDEAREEIKKRWANTELREKIEKELGDRFIKNFSNEPRGMSFRQVCSPDNGYPFFFYCAKYVGVEPLVIEYCDDIFTHLNEDKKGLGRLRVTLKNGERAMVDIMNFHENEKRKLGECILLDGSNLVSFHHKLLEVFKYPVDFLENSKWFHNIGKASDYYYYLLLHCVAHGVLCELFYDNDESNINFANEVVMPAIEKIQKKFKLNPLIIRQYPKNQSDEEDFFWWSYPPNINDYIIDYVRKGGLTFKKVYI